MTTARGTAMPGEWCERAEALPAMKEFSPEDLDHIANCECCRNMLAIITALRSTPEEERDELEPETPECVPLTVLAAFVSGELPQNDMERIRRHLRSCMRCCRQAFASSDTVRGSAGTTIPS